VKIRAVQVQQFKPHRYITARIEWPVWTRTKRVCQNIVQRDEILCQRRHVLKQHPSQTALRTGARWCMCFGRVRLSGISFQII